MSPACRCACNQDAGDAFKFAELHQPQQQPLTVASKLIDQRADVRMADALPHGANAAVGAAIANRLPQVPITDAIGGAAAQIFGPGGAFWNIMVGVTQPIFDGGTLRHRQKAAEQALMQAAMQ